MPTALCVSEDKSFLNNVRVNLGKSGFVVIATSNTTEALVLAEENKLDIIVADYELEQIDGISLFEKIRDHLGDTRTPPALIVSEKYAAPLLSRCVTAGASGLQAKNEPIEIIIERIISLLEDTELRNELELNSPKRAIEGGTDILTRIASKKHFSRRFSAESVASYRDQNSISLLFLSIDRYKDQEERFGKNSTENMLSNVARLIEGELRSRDCVGRYSDYTFSIVLPDTKPDAAKAVADRLRRLLSATEFGNLDHPIAITVSVGVSSRPVGVRTSPSEMITQALRGCTASQELGGNRTIADKKLSGQPISIVVAGQPKRQRSLVNDLNKLNVETRACNSTDEARAMLQNIPAKIMTVVIEETAAPEQVEFLVWVRNKYPDMKRVVVSSDMRPSFIATLVNQANIDYFFPIEWQFEQLALSIDEIVYS